MKWLDLASAALGHRDRATSEGGVATPFLYIAIVLANIGVLVADLYTPLGIAVWIVYLVPVTLSFWLWRPEVPLLLALIATVMMIATFMTDAPGADRTIAQINRGFGILTVWIMAVVGHFFIRSRLAVHHQQWLQTGQTRLSELLRGEHSLEQLSTSLLGFLTSYVDATVGAIYVGDYKELRLVATQGIPKSEGIPESVTAGDGLIGQAVSSKQTYLLSDIPDGYITLSSAFGRGKPRHLLIAPIEADGRVNAVVELGFLREVGPRTVELLRRLSESIGVAIRSTEYRTNLHDLLEETQRQAEELETQSEELRVSNEELEEQGKALKETQRNLELQQVELEQTNTQLEEQAQQLETQRDELAKASTELEARARQLARASQYKSDFLANMSHELRTPLNSSLILAKLLADNPQGNLTEEQVRSANTILSSGNDLLNLINDILDLSKIEAGRMEIRAERVWLERLVGDLKRTFTPLARTKNIEFDITLAPDCPEHLHTDVQRLTQILTNLLSNAIKFTEQGHVALEVSAAPAGRVAFRVSDTGIGIPADQQRVIFEAFHQVDGTANRKFGGTGLGLSIARQLTALLGGEIRLESQVGQGTAFTVELPLEIPATSPSRVASSSPSSSPFLGAIDGSVAEAPATGDGASRPRPVPSPRPAPSRPAPVRRDDREVLAEGDRTLLVVEDDPPFVDILYDLAHELGFKCLVAGTAEEALGMVRRYLPSAVLLDVGLPDQSGLTVLEQLKSDSRLRHIPVHIVSASDYTEAALSMGAVGYMLKPVTRASLVEAFEGLSAKLVQKMRRVLLVEDDPVQQSSLRELLGSREVETVGASSAAECLEQLKNSTFDCMVLDLSLPDASGFTLLETLSREEAYSFPPVIVYTGRDLSSDEEQQLRRYSSSIIIKGAKSPERLLDEVTLFLHQVVEELPLAQQQMIRSARSRESAIENRRILVVEDDVRNVFALTSVLEPRGALIEIARNGKEAIETLEASLKDPGKRIDLVLMDVMMPEMDGLTATRLIRQKGEFKKLPILILTAKAMKEDQQNCLAAGANDYMAKPLDVDKLLSLIRVWMPK